MKEIKNIVRRFLQLHDKFRADSCSVDELSEMQNMLEDEANLEALRAHMMDELEEGNTGTRQPFNGTKLFERLENQIEKQSLPVRKMRQQFSWFQIAASLVLTFLVGGMAAYLVYRGDHTDRIAPSYCEVVAPQGTITQVTLPDSSVVWLNGGSKVTYSSRFNQDDRNLVLEGEAYFKITKNKKLPFLLDTYGFELEAPGAEFNVKAYPDDEKIETFLVEGKVLVSHRSVRIADETYLNRKFSATFYKSKEDATQNGEPRLIISPNSDPGDYTSWKNGKFLSEMGFLVLNRP